MQSDVNLVSEHRYPLLKIIIIIITMIITKKKKKPGKAGVINFKVTSKLHLPLLRPLPACIIGIGRVSEPLDLGHWSW